MADCTLIRRFVPLFPLAAFLLGSGADVYGYHTCPHHSLPAAAPSAEHAAAAGEQGPHAHDAPAGRAESHDEHSGDDHSGPCTCIGLCHATAAAPEPSTPPPAALPAALDLRARRIPTSAESPHRRVVGLLLPYPNGPPIS